MEDNNRSVNVEKLASFISETSDGVISKLQHGKVQMQLFYLRSMVDDLKLQERIIKPFYEMETANQYEQYLLSLEVGPAPKQMQELYVQLCKGYAAVWFGEKLFTVELNFLLNKQIRESNVETVIQGPESAFSESIEVSMNLIRGRYNRPSLKLELTSVGTKVKTAVAIIYDNELVDPKLLKLMKDKLNSVQAEIIQAAGQLQQEMNGRQRRLFPTMMVTERPDRAALNLTQGKIVVMLDGTPFVLIAPVAVFDFMSSMEDVYQSYWISRFLLVLRYIGLFVSLSLPGLYVAITAYNPELFRVQLALSIAGSRMGVPYPAFVEVLFMLLMMELLTEASIRLPKTIGQTATTVGGLILGQAATEAGLVSDIMIIIVAAVAISNFVIPINSFSFAIRCVKYVVLLVSTLYGLIGFVLCTIIMVAYLVNLESMGDPYLKLFKGDDKQIRGGKL
ncbi:spore germination protein [Paenibacillus turpanensis]|uniref:spore germination protein n=1 Tax=Paenibacillus turpanensis TaxID=2689078 RepID=UPI00140892AE|nr:spore germination protein [Paenibacillus turpanensis]